MNDADLKTLINAAVDGELAGHRTPPPWDPSRLTERLPERRHARHPVARWSAPLLAASVAALLAAGTVVAIDHGQNRRSTPVANPATSTPSASPSPSSSSTNPDLAAANRAYDEAVAGAVEATEAPGVTVEQVSAKDAAAFKDSGAWSMPGAPPQPPEPGKSYPITVKYVVGPSTGTNPNVQADEVTVVSAELREVAAGSCPRPFLARRPHTYLIHCQVTFRPGLHAEAAFLDRNPSGSMGTTIYLADPAGSATSPSSSPGPLDEQAARDYAQALAGAPEARAVAGVSERQATAEELKGGETVGSLDTPVLAPKRGKSYPVTLIYIPRSDGPAISVLAISFEGVATGRCPRAFRVRPGHAYRIACQVTFRPGAVGNAYYAVTGPQSVSTIGKNISNP